MSEKANAGDAATVAAPGPHPRFARLTALACTLLALLSAGACSVLPPEHASDLSMAERLRLTAREPYRLTFKFDAYTKAGSKTGGIALWLGDKEHTVMTLPSPRGATTVEYTPGGLYWTMDCQPDGVFSTGSRMAAGPMLLNDFAFRSGPLVPETDGRIAIGEGARPGQPKVTVYLSIEDFGIGMK
jgi:hypothetical protein